MPQAASSSTTNKTGQNSSPPSPTPADDFIVPDDLLSGLSMSKASIARSRNRALTATDFDSILCQL